MFWGYFPSSSHPFSTTTTTTTICTCLRGMFHYVKKHLCYVSITTCTLPYVNYMVSLCLVLNMSEHRSKNAHCRFPWLKLCPQDSVIRVVLFHGLVFFFCSFFMKGKHNHEGCHRYLSRRKLWNCTWKKRDRKEKPQFHSTVTFYWLNENTTERMGLTWVNSGQERNEIMSGLTWKKKKKKTYMDNLALLWEQKTCHLKVPGIAAKEKI